MPARKRKLAVPVLPLQRHLLFGEEGNWHDLGDIFRTINRKYFRRNPLRGYQIVWGRRMRKRPKTYFVFGTIQEQDRVIRIHPLLDARFVPRWFLEYVVYHEMLHARVPHRRLRSGRREVHTEEFMEKEQRFSLFRRAQRWEQENLGRFLR